MVSSSIILIKDRPNVLYSHFKLNTMGTRVRYPEIGKTYDHYKGGKYKVLSLATHTETEETMVVYKSLLFGGTYVRPLSIWFDEVTMDDGSKRERFVLNW